jgi:hypothetical protein
LAIFSEVCTVPRLLNSVPRYRKHRASGQAIVTLSGQDFYLGPHGTKASHLEYDRQVAEWLARGRRPLDGRERAEITCVELIAAYKKFARGYYRKNGQVTNEVTAILSAASFVRQFYGRELVNDFGPLKLQAVQQAMIRKGWARKHINKQISRIVRMFSTFLPRTSQSNKHDRCQLTRDTAHLGFFNSM